MRAVLAVCLSLVLCCIGPFPASADDAAYEAELARQWTLMPRAPKVLRYPSPDGWQVYGISPTPQLRSSQDVIGGKALRVKVKSVTPNVWDIGVLAPSQVKVSKGDVVVGAFWARSVNGQKNAKGITIPARLQMTGEPYTGLGSIDAALTTEWNVYYVHGTAHKDLQEGAMNLSLQVGGGRQTLELGPVILWSLGPGAIDASELPQNISPEVNVVHPEIKQNTSRRFPDIRSSPELLADLNKVRSLIPHEAVLLNNPNVSVANSFGDDQRGRHVNDQNVIGGKAFEVDVGSAGLNSWSAGVNWPTHTGIEKGDTVLLAYWARAVDVHNEAQTGNISAARVQQSKEPYDSAADQAASLDKKWRLYYAQGRSETRIEPGNSGISFHLGLAKQTVRIGPAYVLNYGSEVNPKILPRTRLTYEGMEADAPWRQLALANIEKYRKANLNIKVVDAAGAPVANAKVNVKMTNHNFNFGTFVGHKFVEKNDKKDGTYHKSFHANFNLATAPLYWQDWGWNGNLADNYRATVKYLHNNGIRWRGHPIVWPGETYMPSNTKDQKGDPAKQREMVLAHVRDVMSFVKNYDPIAVDMVNEVRVNQYFTEQGDADLIRDAFHLAHEIAPDIPLFVNDYGILNSGGLNHKSIEFYHDWIKKMRRDNVPLGGIGFQAHFGAGLTPPARVIEILNGFGKYGLPLHITEFDIDTLDVDAQAAYTRDMLIAAFSQPQMEAFVVWGWWEGDHWKSAAAMLNKDWSKKPNYKAWRDLVYGEWWTDETVFTDENGSVNIKSFKGNYEISSGGKTITYQLITDSVLSLTK